MHVYMLLAHGSWQLGGEKLPNAPKGDMLDTMELVAGMHVLAVDGPGAPGLLAE